MGIDFGLSDAQKQLQVNAKAFADQTLKPLSVAVDRMDDAPFYQRPGTAPVAWRVKDEKRRPQAAA